MASHSRGTTHPDRNRPYDDDPNRPTDHDQNEPCKPWDLPEIDSKPQEGPCDCCKPPQPRPDPCQRPPRAKDKNHDCCEQILELLRTMPAGRDLRLKKPKQSTKVKIANLCCKLPVK